MTREPTTHRLSDQQRRNICLLLSTGCDREAAANFARCSTVDLQREILCDPAFAADVRHAEGISELAHIRNVQNAAQDVKNWRASVWWLERRSPERFGRRDAGTITIQQLQAFIAQLASSVFDAIQDPDDRQRLMQRLDQLERSLQAADSCHDMPPSAATMADNPKLLEEVEVDSVASPDGSDLESDDDFAE
jgi:hypothetical protein